MRHWLSPRFMLACRSGDDEPNGGVAGRNGAIVEKVHQGVFPTLKRTDGSELILEFLGTKVVVVGIRQLLNGFPELRTRQSPNQNLLWI